MKELEHKDTNMAGADCKCLELPHYDPPQYLSCKLSANLETFVYVATNKLQKVGEKLISRHFLF